MTVDVTIGLCAKNAEATIAESIDSILKQDFPHRCMEIVVVDGLSKDRTLSIVKEMLKKTDIGFSIHSDNGKGLGAARNIVCRNAGGKYILWVDSDIILPEEHVRIQVDFMEKNPRTGAAKARYGVINRGNLVADIENMRTVKSGLLARMARSHNLSGTGGSIYRISALRQAGHFDQNIRGAGEDIDIAVKIRAKGWKLSTSPAVFYERFRTTWRELWKEYLWWGYGMHYVISKHRILLSEIPLWSHTPPVAFMKGFLQSLVAYKMTYNKKMLLFPFHSAFKMTAWWVGFLRSHSGDYGHPTTRPAQFLTLKVPPTRAQERSVDLPKVTIGICVRNSELTVAQTLKSILDQYYPLDLLEVIAVDDRSHDTTSSIIKEFASLATIEVNFLSTKLGGLGEARQMVVDHASGKYIVWIDGDITVPRSHVREQISILEGQPKIAIAKGKEVSIETGLVSRLESFRPLLHEHRSRNLPLGIGGSTYRVDAIKVAGGFDKHINGAGEDIDIVHRIHEAGWSTVVTPSIFHHRLKGSWQGVWRQYYWYGYGLHFVRHKHRGAISIFPSVPLFALFLGGGHAIRLFKKTKQIISFLLPLQYVLKKTAWCIGYVQGHLDGYGHAQ